jgi:hypothetical protein
MTSEQTQRIAAAYYLNEQMNGFRALQWADRCYPGVPFRTLRPHDPMGDWLMALSLLDADGDYSDHETPWWAVWEIVCEWAHGDGSWPFEPTPIWAAHTPARHRGDA